MNDSETFPPMGKNKKERTLEARLRKEGWQRTSPQHYAKIVGDQELAIDQHIGHFCVGFYRGNRAIGRPERLNSFEGAYHAAHILEKRAP